ncbi:gas vesicle protein GvpO [Prauserella flavalba]|uniref:Gas vesicle protein n=1 Tax=Prauserella flavalba TaxID=1477506 RepID=A0A318LM82_9PSEU|nr:gas vesicle protein [Prauserella flavalba]PXY29811.1 gas vesicle protein [Prauserella flavalba]
MAGAQDASELPAPEAAEVAVEHIGKLTGREIVGVTSVEPTDDGWRVEIEVVEERRIPSTSDLLALYEVDLDLGGELLAYRRTRRFNRGRGDSGNGMA